MKRLLLLVLLIGTIFQGVSQTKGISYQAVILNPQPQELPGQNAENNILANSTVSIQFTILNASGTEEYQEQHSTTTDKYGMLNLLIGTGSPTSGTSFTDVFWNGTTKKLKVGIDFKGGTNFSALSEQDLTYMPQPPTQETTQQIVDNSVSISEEVARATAAEQINATTISEEVARATAVEQINATMISEEVARATAVEQINATTISEEVTRATAAEQINATTISEEVARATAAEQINATTISEEVTRAKAAEAANLTAISTLQGEQIIQNNAISLNTAKVSDINHVAVSTTDDLTEGTTNLYYTEARVTANTAVAANTTHVTKTDNPHSVTKAQVGLGNVNNTSDADKPVSTATQTALDGKVDENSAITGATKTKITYDAKGLVTAGADATTTDIAEGTNLYYTEARVAANTAVAANTTHATKTDNPHSVTKAQVGLGNVDNTSDADKPVSTATQTALDGKVDENSAITGATKTKITYDAKGLVTAGADATTTDIAEGTNLYYTEARVAANTAVAANTTHATKTDNPHSVTKAQVGLGNVNNTSDADKPVSTATQTALDGKVDENSAITGATKTKITYDAKGLVTAGADATTTDIAEGTNLYYTEARVTANTAVAASTTHATKTDNPHSVTKAQVGLGNVNNTSDANKPVSTATQTALDGKVDENSAITGATKTKITYDAKGLVTAGADATTADIAASTDKNYVTDAQKTVIASISNTGSGNIITSTERTKLNTIEAGAVMTTGNQTITGSKTFTGTTKFADGTQGAGKVLTSDASGNASWQVSGGASTMPEYVYAYIGNASTLGPQTLTAMFPAATYVNGVVMNGSSITLHANKMYEVTVAFYIYNASGGHTFKMKDATNSAYLGTEIYFGQGGSDVSYNMSTTNFLFKPSTDVNLELEKTQGTDVNLIGKIVVKEIR
ncbi:hypothetical protein MHL31_01095 [Lutibacter sp. A80]|uniref:hypothetical protein n=1 Tax=Lutibacter sp. A80 TaxID=2918453 RepID=UPI001F06FD0B|nr:hypothetical protein [Lutibacter sp. A80]UMB60824.1 hypothetical protein MHL31_01095 [Lutibacter sp. A80]